MLLAKTMSTVIAATVAFLGNRFWTWRHRERSGLRREYLLYFFFNAVGLGIGLACLAISHYGLGSIWPDVFQTQLADNISGTVRRHGVRHAVPLLVIPPVRLHRAGSTSGASPATPPVTAPVTERD